VQPFKIFLLLNKSSSPNFMKGSNKLIRVFKANEIVINVILIICYPLLFISLGMDFTDCPWSLRMSNLPDDNFILYWLTAKIASIWYSLFTYSILSNRILSYIIFELIILLIFASFFYNKNKLQFSRYALVSVIIMMSTNSHTFGYDRLSLFLLTIILLSLIRFIQYNKSIYLVLAGFVSILATLARFPNIVIIPILFGLISIITITKLKNKPKSLKIRLLPLSMYWLIFCFSCLLTLSSFFLFVMSPQEFHVRIFDAIFSGANGLHHSIGNLWSNYIRDLLTIVKNIGVLVLLSVTFIVSIKYIKLKKWIISSAIFLSYLFYLALTNNGNYNFDLSLNITALIFFIYFVLGYSFVQSKKYIHISMLLVFFVFMFIPAIGSDTGLLKIYYFASIIIIYLLYFLSKENTVFRLQRNFIYILILAVVAYSLYNRFNWFYGDSKNITELKYEINHKKLHNIKTTIHRKELVEKVIDNIDVINTTNKKVYFFGHAGQMFYYLYDKQPLSKQFFYLKPDNKDAVNQLKSTFIEEKTNPIIVVFYGFPNSPRWPQYLINNDRALKKERNMSKYLISMLLNNNYKKVVSEDAFEIYK